MDMRLIIPIEKAVEAVEVKKELKVPPCIHIMEERQDRKLWKEQDFFLILLSIKQFIISSALPQWNNILNE